MNVGQLHKISGLNPLVESDLQQEITEVYCCDLISLVMGRAPAQCVWVTVMGNVNALAVATLAEISCIVLAEGVMLEEELCTKAKEKGINVYTTQDTIFSVAKKLDTLLISEKM